MPYDGLSLATHPFPRKHQRALPHIFKKIWKSPLLQIRFPIVNSGKATFVQPQSGASRSGGTCEPWRLPGPMRSAHLWLARSGDTRIPLLESVYLGVRFPLSQGKRVRRLA